MNKFEQVRALIKAFLALWKSTPPSASLPLQGEGESERPMMVDAGLLGMKQEIGLVWQRYPSVKDIQRTLKMSRKQARWIHKMCRVEGDLLLSIVIINDVARALMDGERRVYQIVVADGKVIKMPVEWKRG